MEEKMKAVLWPLYSGVSRTHWNTLQFSRSPFWDEPFRKVDYSGSRPLLNPLLISSLPTSFFSRLFFLNSGRPPAPLCCLTNPRDLQFSSWNVSHPIPPVLFPPLAPFSFLISRSPLFLVPLSPHSHFTSPSCFFDLFHPRSPGPYSYPIFFSLLLLPSSHPSVSPTSQSSAL